MGCARGGEEDPMTIPTQPFGRTGHESTRTIFGAAALSRGNPG